jgi:hypothetical protein
MNLERSIKSMRRAINCMKVAREETDPAERASWLKLADWNFEEANRFARYAERDAIFEANLQIEIEQAA